MLTDQKNKPQYTAQAGKVKSKKQLRKIAQDINIGDMKSAKKRWRKLMTKQYADVDRATVHAAVHHVLFETQLETNRNLQYYAAKVRFNNMLAVEIRRELLQISTMSNNSLIQPIETLPEFNMKVASNGGPILQRRHEPLLDREISEYEQWLGLQLAALVEDVQLANLDLQHMLEKQQQEIKMLPDVSRMMHDAAQQCGDGK